MKLEISNKLNVLVNRGLVWVHVTSGEMTAKFNMSLTYEKNKYFHGYTL